MSSKFIEFAVDVNGDPKKYYLNIDDIRYVYSSREKNKEGLAVITIKNFQQDVRLPESYESFTSRLKQISEENISKEQQLNIVNKLLEDDQKTESSIYRDFYEFVMSRALIADSYEIKKVFELETGKTLPPF